MLDNIYLENLVMILMSMRVQTSENREEVEMEKEKFTDILAVGLRSQARR